MTVNIKNLCIGSEKLERSRGALGGCGLAGGQGNDGMTDGRDAEVCGNADVRRKPPRMPPSEENMTRWYLWYNWHGCKQFQQDNALYVGSL